MKAKLRSAHIDNDKKKKKLPEFFLQIIKSKENS